jgi:TolB-like protein
MSEINKDQQIESLEEKVTHLSRMLVKSFGYADQDPDTFLQNARRTTEAICRFMYTKEFGEPKSRMMLNDYGRELLNKKVIPDKIGILIGTIQTYGNYAAHAQDDLSAATREWIAPCQTALASLTNWFFLEYLKGNVPNELLTPVQSFSETNAHRNTTANVSPITNRSKTNTIVLTVISLVVIAVSAFLVIKNSNSENKKDTAIAPSDNVVKTEEQMVDNLNSVTPNPDAKRIAILYFDNGSDNAELSRLKKGLADMLISDLSKIKMLNVIERARLEEILKEQKLNNSKEFDASTASKVGKLLGVQYILTGSFFDLMGSMRMDARIIDVETGKIIKSEGIDGATNTFFDLEKKLVVKIAGGLNVDLADANGNSSSINKETTLSYETSLHFSDGLELMDKGENAKAIEIFKNVIQKNPDFIPAQQALNKLQKKV